MHNHQIKIKSLIKAVIWDKLTSFHSAYMLTAVERIRKDGYFQYIYSGVIRAKLLIIMTVWLSHPYVWVARNQSCMHNVFTTNCKNAVIEKCKKENENVKNQIGINQTYWQTHSWVHQFATCAYSSRKLMNATAASECILWFISKPN